MKHKAGYVNMIGAPNVGKSTLMNAFVGERLSIITSKAQTTRHRITGIVNTEEYQIIYSDLPGVIKPVYKLQESMMGLINVAFSDADVLLFVTDVYEDLEVPEEILKKINSSKVPVLLLINKIDKSHQEKLEVLANKWRTIIPKAEIFPVSAIEKFNIETVSNRILALLPEHPPYYEKDQLTDKNERFFVSEIIREKILEQYQKEIPYCSEVVVQAFKELPEIIRISAEIFVERESQKPIIIGKGGLAIKKLGTSAREDIENFFAKKVFLELFVKVDKDWRNNDNRLKRFGY